MKNSLDSLSYHTKYTFKSFCKADSRIELVGDCENMKF